MNPFSRDKQLVKLGQDIEKLTREVAGLRAERSAASEAVTLNQNILSLRKQVSELEITRDKKQEEFDRRERELTHMIGLEKKRQEVETKQSKQEAVLAVREENLSAQRSEFEKQMKFRQERFDGEVAYLQGLMSKILERLPSVTVDRTITEAVGAGRRK